ncbi:MAG: HAD-IB family phosphatase [Candidatus Micrarchaeota archaeon]
MKRGPYEKVSAVIPAFNESAYIAKVIRAARQVRYVNEILVVDDGSEDGTGKIARVEGARVVRHKKNLGKGAAIKTGIKKARGEVVLFLDADLGNITPRKISSLIKPVLVGEADFVKSGFTLKRGRVTELTVKPLMRLLFPNVLFSQPISGQFCARRDFLRKLRLVSDWGVDIAILLDAVKANLRIKEVDLGALIHKKRPLEEKVLMAEEVARIIMEKAGVLQRKGLVAFDLDGTLLASHSLDAFAREWGFEEELGEWRKMLHEGTLLDTELALLVAKKFKGKTEEDVASVCARIPLARNARKAVQELKARGFKIALITCALSPIAEYFREKLGADYVRAPLLRQKEGRFTGHVDIRMNRKCCSTALCKAKALRALARKEGLRIEECVAVGNSDSDVCMVRTPAFGVAINASESLKKVADVGITDLGELPGVI